MFSDLGIALELGIILAGIITAAIWLKSSLATKNKNELESLVETRGDRIDDLDGIVERLNDRILILEGQISVLQGDMGDKIANTVSGRLREDLAFFVETKDH